MDTLQAMRAVTEVAHLGSFTAAARSLKMSVPSISRLVSDLETDLGVRLFNRTTRRIALTDTGAEYLRRSGAILEEIDELREITQDLHRRPGGTLVLSSVISFGTELLAPVIPAFMERYPGVKVDLSITTRTVDLVNEHVDVAFRIGVGSGLPDSSLVATKVSEQRLIFVAAPDYLSRAGTPQRLEDIKRHRVVKFATGRYGHVHRLQHGEDQTEYTLPDDFVVDSPRAALTAAVAGFGCALVHDHAARSDVAAGSLVRVLPEFATVPQPIFAVYAHRRYVAARIRLFIDFLQEAFRGRGDGKGGIPA